MVTVRVDVPDEMLMVRYQRGDREAFAELVRRYQRGIYNFVLRQLGNPAQAQDVTQDVFLRLVQSAPDFKHEARFSTWLYTIARNLCVDEVRRGKHRSHASLDQPLRGEQKRALADDIADPHPRSSAERMAGLREVQDSVMRAVAALSDEQREVFLLREIANLPFKEIAIVTGVSENTVKSRMRYALDRLQQALTDFEEYARALR